MSIFKRDQVSIYYEVVGDRGAWIVLTPGGRNGLEDLRYLADELVGKGYRVLLHDRRNCGQSDVFVDGELSEQEVWVDDVHALLRHLDALPVIAGGGSAGCRLSLLLAHQYPGSVRGLLLWWVTGGRHAADHLGQEYYGQFIDIAASQGLAGVCETDFFSQRIIDNPANREILMSMPTDHFVAVMSRWRDYFLQGAELPVIGLSAEQLQAIGVPTLIVPGSDAVHPRANAVLLDQLLPDSQLQYPFEKADLAALKQQSSADILQAFRRRLVDHCTTFLAQKGL